MDFFLYENNYFFKRCTHFYENLCGVGERSAFVLKFMFFYLANEMFDLVGVFKEIDSLKKSGLSNPSNCKDRYLFKNRQNFK